MSKRGEHLIRFVSSSRKEMMTQKMVSAHFFDTEENESESKTGAISLKVGLTLLIIASAVLTITQFLTI